MGELEPGGDVAGEGSGLERATVVGDHDDRAQLAGGGVDQVVEQRPTEQAFGLDPGGLDRGDIASRWVQVVAVVSPNSYLAQ